MLFTLTCVSLKNTFANDSIICPVLFLNLFLLSGICEACYVMYLLPSSALTQQRGAGGGGGSGTALPESVHGLPLWPSLGIPLSPCECVFLWWGKVLLMSILKLKLKYMYCAKYNNAPWYFY